MDKPIDIGDLVMFVKSCCDGFRDGVSIFKVQHIKPSRPAGFCTHCLTPLPMDRYAADDARYGGAPVSWLKRIPPLGELGDVKRDEEITA